MQTVWPNEVLAVAEHLVRYSKNGTKFDPQVTVAEVAKVIGLSEDEVLFGVLELEDRGLVEISREIIDARNAGARRFWPTIQLFVEFDTRFFDFDTKSDAVAIANWLVGDKNIIIPTGRLELNLPQMSVRRMNSALNYLEVNNIVEPVHTIGEAPWTMGHIQVTDRTRRFVRDHVNDRKIVSAPPDVPPQEPGSHFILRDDGVVAFAPLEALDREGNNIARLRVIHPTLRKLVLDLLETLGRGNVAHANLSERVQGYRELIDQDLETVPFDRLYVEGVRLQNAAFAANEKIGEKELPPFEAPTREALESILTLHGTFMMSTAVGLEMIGAEERYQRKPQEERELREATEEFARELQGRPDIIAPEAATFLLGAAKEIGAGTNPERSAIVATGTTKNAVIVLVSGATLGALPIVGGVVGGPPGFIGGGLIALVGVEGLKKSKSFLAVAGIVTQGLDDLKDANLQEIIIARGRRLTPYVDFVLKIEPALRRLGERTQFRWLNASLDWIKGNRSGAEGAEPLSKSKEDDEGKGNA